MICEIWSRLDICLYHAAYVRTYAGSTAMRLAGSRRRETILEQMSQADRDFLQEDHCQRNTLASKSNSMRFAFKEAVPSTPSTPGRASSSGPSINVTSIRTALGL